MAETLKNLIACIKEWLRRKWKAKIESLDENPTQVQRTDLQTTLKMATNESSQSIDVEVQRPQVKVLHQKKTWK